MAFQAANPDINLTLIAPELIVGIAGVVIMLVDAFGRRGQRWVTGALSIAALVAAGVASVWLGTGSSAPHHAFNGMIVLDELRLSFTLIFLIVSILTILIAMVWIEVEGLPAGEFHALLLFATCGLMLMASAGDLIVGFGFKIATAPFHVWTPDVYEGAPTPVTAFMAAGPKAAGFASFMRVFLFGFPIATAAASTGGYAHKSWIGALAIMAALTMSVGNIVAIVQDNVKRMLAYSSIAHAGYALVGFVAAGAAADAEQRSAALTAVT